MRAIIFDSEICVVSNFAKPERKAGWSLIRLIKGGICNTDLEILKGYMNFKGVMGHEFIGEVVESDKVELIGKRIVGEINAACGICTTCLVGLGRFCPNRSVLGIQSLNGCFSDFFVLPDRNIHIVAPEISDNQAVFIEPLAAAYEVTEQIIPQECFKCVVLGDGKLGVLCAWVLSTFCADVTIVGKHSEKLQKAFWNGIKTVNLSESMPSDCDLTVEATGTIGGLQNALEITKPRGVVALKSTVAGMEKINLSLAVVKEISIIGSRCGPFYKALQGMKAHHFPVERLVDGEYKIEEGIKAFQKARERGVAKILLNNCAKEL
ncbi:MAG: alcohol dehydrogenase catalytic domain-containing protein [Candidatus Riflebacteria bacterium]|nr:alcohol dehydrogenase catalytic domain-containing protein [Candidatus Riflebacteria bacterium]